MRYRAVHQFTFCWQHFIGRLMNRGRFNLIIFGYVRYDIFKFAITKHTYINMLNGRYLVIKQQLIE